MRSSKPCSRPAAKRLLSGDRAYDMIGIAEAPDEETMAKVGLASAAKGSIRAITLRAFTEDEYRHIISALP